MEKTTQKPEYLASSFLYLECKEFLLKYYFSSFLLLLFAIFPEKIYASPECRSLEEQPIKFEAWLSKNYRADLAYLRKEFSAMGSTKVVLWEYPTKNPSGVVAIGRCVPAFIARYAIQKALTYTEGVKSLVNQGFLYQHWVGIGTNLFSEWAQQPVTPEQVKSLLDDTLSTREFQNLYRKYTNQEKMVYGFGIQVPNPKLMIEKDLKKN
tara:strand:- start:357 stop:983 length:627 start_codon:yes stop_codon:yes gene_type:complete